MSDFTCHLTHIVHLNVDPTHPRHWLIVNQGPETFRFTTPPRPVVIRRTRAHRPRTFWTPQDGRDRHNNTQESTSDPTNNALRPR